MALRSSPIRAIQHFSATASKQAIRQLHVTGAVSNPSQILSKSSASPQSLRDVAESKAELPQPTRQFNTTRSFKAVNDTSTIDFAYMPQFTLEPISHPEIQRIPLLPDNYAPARHGLAHQDAVEPVIRPEIVTASADGTHLAPPSAMSEVTDNHALDLDPYDLARQVGRAANHAMIEKVEQGIKEAGVIKELWTGIFDDLLRGGSKKVSSA
ncbi:hypothetical protein MMC06_005933 [Schaereria dolodes]|nr:hypothetical protein [Schaereria dolodes]